MWNYITRTFLNYKIKYVNFLEHFCSLYMYSIATWLVCLKKSYISYHLCFWTIICIFCHPSILIILTRSLPVNWKTKHLKYREIIWNTSALSVVNDFYNHLPAVRQGIIQVNKWKNERKEVHLEPRNAL